ncbi:MAG: folate-binding protein [Pseudomonadota bacterium]
MIALFALLRRDAQTLWLLLPDADPSALTVQLKRFVFRSNVAFHVRDDLLATGAFAAPVQAAGSTVADTDEGVELDASADGGLRRLRLGNNPAALDQRQLSRWRLFDLQHGLPRLAPDQGEQWTPQQLSLERLNAYSVRKGCYPGQEIVARTHFLGKAKRGLWRMQGTGVAALGEVMAGADGDVRAVGRMVCAEADEGLAVVPLEAVDSHLSTNSQPCAVLPLLAGLAR